MNLYRNFLRMLLSAGSVLGFVFGWAFLSHNNQAVTATESAATSAQAQVIQVVPTAAAVNTESQSVLQLFNFQAPSARSQQQNFQPQLRTGGS